MINERIDALRKRERVCWDMSEVFLHARDAHGLHDMGVEIQGIQWALRELEAITEGQAAEIERLREHLISALDTLKDAEVCDDNCGPCNEARAALGQSK